VHQLSDLAIKDLVTGTISGTAAGFVARTYTQHPGISWLELRGLLKDRYSNDCGSILALERLKKIKQKENESIPSLAERLIDASEEAFSELERRSSTNAKELIGVFVKALRNDALHNRIARSLITHLPGSLEEAIKKAIKMQKDEETYAVTRGVRDLISNSSAGVDYEEPMDISMVSGAHGSRGKYQSTTDVLIEQQYDTNRTIDGLRQEQENTQQTLATLTQGMAELTGRTRDDASGSESEQSEDEEWLCQINDYNRDFKRENPWNKSHRSGTRLPRVNFKLPNGKRYVPFRRKENDSRRHRNKQSSPSIDYNDFQKGSKPYRNRSQSPAGGARFRSQSPRGTGAKTCFQCGKEGHIKADCWTKTMRKPAHFKKSLN
jgi:hypothetical protein